MANPRLLGAILGIITMLSASNASSEQHSKDMQTFLSEVQANPLTNGGSWLEVKNVFGDWEKVVLVFGYADPGDYAACEEIRAAKPLPSQFRCDPVQ